MIGFAVDMDGTVYKGEVPIPGASGFIEALRKRDIPFRFLTNNSSHPRSFYAERLNRIGIPAEVGDILTSTLATVRFILNERPGETVYVIATPEVEKEIRDAGIPAPVAGRRPDIVLLTYDTTIDYKKINDGFHHLLSGSELIATHPDDVCPTERSYDVDIGPFIRLYESLAHCRATVIGKPNRRMLEMAGAEMGISPEDVVMVGDRLSTDIRMAMDASTRSVLVLSGETDMELLDRSDVRPTFVEKSVADIVPDLVDTGRLRRYLPSICPIPGVRWIQIDNSLNKVQSILIITLTRPRVMKGMHAELSVIHPDRDIWMYLKQIELENFKSFGGKITIPLMEGYMAVTGPNGSGKSNIGDAILFVLGPKSSKAMRAGRLTDLIFDGGASKSKAKFMTVSLVFDNSDRMMPWDADIVRLTRYVKVSGNGVDYSSYFYINEQKSSLSEFDTLLTKARISADGYNLVQQGDVTRIVQMGAMERRRILDGISGIASFDADIQKAQGERSEAGENLSRIKIIEGEKSRRLKALEKDKQQAEVYLKAKTSRDIANSQLKVRLRDNRAAGLESIMQYISKIDNQIGEQKEIKSKAVAEQESNEASIESKEREIEEKAGPEYRKIKEDVEAARIGVATEKDRVDSALSDKETQLGFRASFEESLEQNEVAKRTHADELAGLSAKRDDADALKKSADAEEKSISEAMLKHGGEVTELQKKTESLDISIEEAGAKDQEAKAEEASRKAVETEAERAKADAEEELEAARFAVKDADWNLGEVKRTSGPVTDTEELSRKVLELKRREAEHEKQEAELRRISQVRTEEFNRLSAEKRVSDSYNSRNEAVNRILAMKESGQIHGIHGTISSLATVEKGWDTALSVAAGGKMSAVVVDDDSVAAECISFLRENRLGRVTFLPLNKMFPGKPRAKAIMAVKKTRGYATDMIDFDPRYTSAFWYVFGDTMLVDGMDQARAIMGGVRLVTRAGDLIEASGAMVGGTVNKKRIPKFGASSQTELDKAAASKKEADDALESVMAKLREIRTEIRDADDLMREANASGADVRGRIAEAEAASKAARKALEGAKQTLSGKEEALQEARSASAKASESAAKTDAALASLRQQRAEARTRMQEIAPAGLQEKIQKARDAAYRAGQTLTDLDSQIGAVKVEIAGLDKQKEALEAQVAEVDRKIAEDDAKAEEHRKALESCRKNLDAVKAIESEMETGLEGLRSERDALVERKYNLASMIEKAQARIETQESIKLSQQASAKEARAEIAHLDEEIAAEKARTGQDVPLPIPSEESLRATIKECERQMGSVGNVNMRALQDYDETKVELDDLHAQMDRLDTQIKSLEKLTLDLTARKKGLFMQAYDAVDSNFKEIYKELSGGGEAFMALDDPGNPFDGGLQINAKPRNGKLLRLEALSGGEKSLTALSFIFAIQEYQPSPFYMLDEVDMFLDAVNAEMVAKRVKESSNKAQFIQVSLRKVTLTRADHLIGVTRPPSGISRILMQPDLEEVSKYEAEALRRQKAAAESGLQR